MARHAVFLILIFFSPCFVAAGTAPISCSSHFQKLIFGKESSYLQIVTTAEERAAIADAAANSRGWPEASKKIWASYVETRMAAVPKGPGHAALKSELLKYFDDIKFRGDGNIVANSGKTEVPEKFRETAALLAIIAHEAEHNIQFSQVDRASPSAAKDFRILVDVVFNPVTKWRSETGAMRAEWEMINALPPEMIADAKEVIRTQVKSDYFREAMLAEMDAHGMPLDEYLKLQYRLGRHSFGNAARVTGHHLVITVGVMTATYKLLRLGGNAAFAKFCENMSLDNPIRQSYCENAFSPPQQ